MFDLECEAVVWIDPDVLRNFLAVLWLLCRLVAVAVYTVDSLAVVFKLADANISVLPSILPLFRQDLDLGKLFLGIIKFEWDADICLSLVGNFLLLILIFLFLSLLEGSSSLGSRVKADLILNEPQDEINSSSKDSSYIVSYQLLCTSLIGLKSDI